MQGLGLAIHIDRVGNILGIRPGQADLPPVMTGSHLDTVATGGMLDGSLGVLAGLEVVQALNEARVPTRRPLAVAVFTNEEGVRFQPDMLGSLVYAGGLAVEEALAAVAADGAVFGAELARIGYAGPVPPGAIVPHAFVELHIEQGPILDREGGALGAVEALQGISWQEIAFRGAANHAGTTPISLRQDAGLGAARLVCYARDLAAELGGGQVATVGSIRLAPGLINVIPREAVVTLDLRNPDGERLGEAERRIAAFLRDLAAAERLEVAARPLARTEPVVFDAGVVRTIEAAAAALGQPIRRMTSGAGQDAQMLARLCPTAMIFVPSIGGVSHSPEERTDPAHLALGADLLLHTLLRLADEPAGQ
jgi:N-carbamoyl-L-amino-acid hydrolase